MLASPLATTPSTRASSAAAAADASPPAPVPLLGATVAAAVRGDADAWHWLFDRYYLVVYRYAMARLGDPSAAEEIAQEVFTAALSGIHRLRERSDPGVEAWFVGIARIKVLDRCRQEARRSRPFVVEDRRDDPQELAASRLATGELWDVMAALTEDQRDVLVRRFVLDQSLEQVAAATGRQVNAVKALQHRAVGAMSRLLRGRPAGRVAA